MPIMPAPAATGMIHLGKRRPKAMFTSMAIPAQAMPAKIVPINSMNMGLGLLVWGYCVKRGGHRRKCCGDAYVV